VLLVWPLAAVAGAAQRIPRTYLDFYAAPLYLTRVSDGVLFTQAHLHHRLGARAAVTVFLTAALTKDTRSTGGNLPAIFSDNVATLGVGFGAQAGPYAIVRAEANLAANLVRTTDHPDPAEADTRVLGAISRRWERPNTPGFFEVYGSAGYYSRHRDNGIAYLQLRGGRRLSSTQPLYGYLRLNLIKDTNRDFYNNAAEAGPGLEWRAGGPLNLSARAEYLVGVYYGIEGRDPNPFGPSYHDFRVILVLGRRWLL
jgi:hypothetical protein